MFATTELVDTARETRDRAKLQEEISGVEEIDFFIGILELELGFE